MTDRTKMTTNNTNEKHLSPLIMILRLLDATTRVMALGKPQVLKDNGNKTLVANFDRQTGLEVRAYSYAQSLIYSIQDMYAQFAENDFDLNKINIIMENMQDVMHSQTPYCAPELINDIASMIRNNAQEVDLEDAVTSLYNPAKPFSDEVLKNRVSEIRDRVLIQNAPDSVDLVPNHYGFFALAPDPIVKEAVERHHQTFLDAMQTLTRVINEFQAQTPTPSPSSGTNHHRRDMTRQM